MSIEGWYYLHENGSIIYKPRPDAVVDIRDSDFARMLWPMDSSDRMGAWRILVEATTNSAEGKLVEDDSDKIERALAELVDKIVPGLDTGSLLDDAATASRALDRPMLTDSTLRNTP